MALGGKTLPELHHGGCTEGALAIRTGWAGWPLLTNCLAYSSSATSQGTNAGKLDPFVFGIQLARKENHSHPASSDGIEDTWYSPPNARFLPFSQVYRVFIIPYNVWKCCIFNGFWVPEWTLFRTNLVCLPGSVLPPSCFRHLSKSPSAQQAEPLSHPASFLVLFCL